MKSKSIALVTTDPRVMGGTPVFAGSRVSIESVVASLDRGIGMARLQASWPFLTAEHIGAARAYIAKRPVPVLTPEQEAFLSAISDSKLFTLEAVLARHASTRPVPPLTQGQVAFYGGLTSNPDAFSLAKVTSIADKLSAPQNAHFFTKEAAHRAFAHLKPVDLDMQSRHVTPADGNVFEDLGFEPDEAARLLAEADRKIGNDDGKET